MWGAACATTSQQVDAAVADVHPVGVGALDDARCAGGARADLRWQALAERHDGVVCAADREVQEAFRVEQRPAGLPELCDHGADGDLGGAGAIGVATHAVYDREERRVVIERDGDPVLVFFAIAEEAQIRVLDLQGTLRHACSHVNFCRIYNTRARSA